MRPLLLAATLALLLPADKVFGHEFWIDPLRYTVEPGEELQADLRVGSEFNGVVFSYLPRNFTRFEVETGGELRAVDGRLGDTPALAMPDMAEGLAVVLHETSQAIVHWREWDRFVGFVEHKDFGDAAALQDGRGLPREDFRESYTRHAKSLVAVGDGAGADRHFGLRTEIVALANPYTDDLTGGLPVQVWDRDTLRADVQVELFDLAPDGEIAITYHRTDAEGVAVLPVEPGHEYLVDAVILEPREPDEASDAVWHTYWASLTFAVPG
ncbi:DUF4198 domain-containing protein [Rhodobacterales bacterium HKCCE2091]|nr:DUF4198 domain-containing protein [Rhodobacterales bacterium HKCCE2091]